MKAKLIKLFLAIAALGLISCGTGTNLYFGPDGVVVSPPTAPIVIPTK